MLGPDSLVTLTRPPMRFPCLTAALGAALTNCEPVLRSSPVAFMPTSTALPTAFCTRWKKRKILRTLIRTGVQRGPGRGEAGRINK